MKKLIILACCAAALTVASGASAYFTQDQLPPTWHIHNGGTCSQCAGVAFFPKILTGGDVNLYKQDPAECPDATDKAFLGGGQPSPQPPAPGVNGNQPLREGICMTSTTIIHLKSIAPDQPAPDGWTYLSASGGFATYYMLTSY
jgi:hypothetical protein